MWVTQPSFKGSFSIVLPIATPTPEPRSSSRLGCLFTLKVNLRLSPSCLQESSDCYPTPLCSECSLSPWSLLPRLPQKLVFFLRNDQGPDSTFCSLARSCFHSLSPCTPTGPHLPRSFFLALPRLSHPILTTGQAWA